MFKVIRIKNDEVVAICTNHKEAIEVLNTLNYNQTPENVFGLAGMDETDIASLLHAIGKWMPGAMRKI